MQFDMLIPILVKKSQTGPYLKEFSLILVNGRRNDCITLLFLGPRLPGLAVKKSPNYPTYIKVRKDMQMIFSIQKNSSFFVMIICYVFQGSISFFGNIGMYVHVKTILGLTV